MFWYIETYLRLFFGYRRLHLEIEMSEIFMVRRYVKQGKGIDNFMDYGTCSSLPIRRHLVLYYKFSFAITCSQKQPF